MTALDPLHDLKLRFLDRCRSNIDTLMEAADDWRLLEPGERRVQIVKIVHSLAGTGGIFGFDALSARARDLETYLISGNQLDAGKARGLFGALNSEVLSAIENRDQAPGHLHPSV